MIKFKINLCYLFNENAIMKEELLIKVNELAVTKWVRDKKLMNKRKLQCQFIKMERKLDLKIKNYDYTRQMKDIKTKIQNGVKCIHDLQRIRAKQWNGSKDELSLKNETIKLNTKWSYMYTLYTLYQQISFKMIKL